MKIENNITDSADTDLRPCPECGKPTPHDEFVDLNSDAVCLSCYPLFEGHWSKWQCVIDRANSSRELQEGVDFKGVSYG